MGYAATPAADLGDEELQPGMVDGEHVVPEEMLGARELTLGLGEVTLARMHAAQRNCGVGTEPRAVRAERVDERLGPLGVGACTRPPTAVQGDERKGRAGEGVLRMAAVGVRVLDCLHRDVPGLVDPAREIEGACIGAQRRHLRARRLLIRPGDLNRPPTRLHRTPDVAVR